MGLLFFFLLAIVVLVVVGAAFMGLLVQLLWWALIGLIIGGLARLILPGPRPIGAFATALAGIGGALLGGIIANALGVGSIIQFIIAVLVAAVFVAVIGGSAKRRPAY
jgi:uncharacterized membrane protein YeaQ/YmgE (transglycosylase-associated protein family)